MAAPAASKALPASAVPGAQVAAEETAEPAEITALKKQ
jgi:hypothetical protein